MLKRYQVLLPDWLEDYIKFLVEKYDLSFSEVIRAELCIAILNMVPRLFPNLKTEISGEDIAELVKKNLELEMDRGESHSIMSKIYFEARKAVEYRLAQEKKKEKK